MPSLSLHSPLGPLTLREEGGALIAIDWGRSYEQDGSDLLASARDQLTAYFDGDLTDFDLPLAPAGTTFQQRVWAAMRAIPYGEVRTYGDIAGLLQSAPRAVGTACGRNPLPIVIPCHRIVGANGALTGYTGDGGLATKRFLLDLEGGGARLL